MGTLTVHSHRYIAERRARGELTRGSALRAGYTLASFAESFGSRPLRQFGLRSVERWSGQHPEWRPGTRSVYLSTVRGFAVWLARQKLVGPDCLVDMKVPKRPRPAPRPIPRDATTSLLGALPDARARVVIQLMYGTGLRCCGVASLLVEDVDFVAKTLHVTEKGGHSRRLPLMPQVEAAIHTYLAEYPSTSGPLIRSYTRPWAGISAQQIGKLVVRWMYSTGVKARAGDGRGAHALRHSCLTEVAEATADPFTLKELAGWADISTAAHYVKTASVGKVREALAAR